MEAKLFAAHFPGLKRQRGLSLKSQWVRANLSSSAWIRKIIANPLLLETGQLRLLREAGFAFTYVDTLWIDHYLALAAFRKKYGHCHVPTHLSRHEKLGKWVSLQRTRRRQGKLSRSRQKALQELGVVLDLEEFCWESRIRDLKTFIAKNGHSRVPSHTGSSLAIWMANMRRRAHQLSPSKKRQLDNLGFVWNPLAEDWKTGLDELKKFYAKHGHGNAPARSNTYPKAGALVQLARHRYRKGALSRESIRQLKSLKVDWNPLETLWRQRFGELKAVGKRLGHLRLPKGWPENRTLERWARNQRENFHLLPKHKQDQLRKIGFPTALRKHG